MVYLEGQLIILFVQTIIESNWFSRFNFENSILLEQAKVQLHSLLCDTYYKKLLSFLEDTINILTPQRWVLTNIKEFSNSQRAPILHRSFTGTAPITSSMNVNTLFQFHCSD